MEKRLNNLKRIENYDVSFMDLFMEKTVEN